MTIGPGKWKLDDLRQRIRELEDQVEDLTMQNQDLRNDMAEREQDIDYLWERIIAALAQTEAGNE